MLRIKDNQFFFNNDKENNIPDNNRILIVDDNEEIHKDLKKILLNPFKHEKQEFESLKAELFGETEEEESNFVFVPVIYEIDSAFQGQEALQMVEQAEKDKKPYALIFMDVRMPPGWDGIETISRIWNKFPDIEMVICSAYSDYPWEKIVSKLGPTDKLLFLQKPFAYVEVQQMSLALIRKWNLVRKEKQYVQELEAKVYQRTRQLENLIGNLKVAIVVTEPDGEIIFNNPRAKQFFAEDDLSGKNIVEMMMPFPEIAACLKTVYDNFSSSERINELPASYYGEKDSSTFKFTLLNLEGKDIIDPNPSVLFLIEDVTDWHNRINTDGLTGLWNHRYFKELLEKEIKKAERYKTSLSVIMIDVDHFKVFNDTYGHQTGDNILKAIADVLRKFARETDILVRYGGEEFVVVLPMTSEEGAGAFAERIRKNIEEMSFFDIYDRKINSVTVSLGVASFEHDSSSSLVEKADQALYHGKSKGRNCIVLYSEINRHI